MSDTINDEEFVVYQRSRIILHKPSGIWFSFSPYSDPERLWRPTFVGGNLQDGKFDRDELRRAAVRLMKAQNWQSAATG